MKRKVKKYAGGMLTDSSGNPVRSGSGEVVRTRFGKDDEDRPKFSGIEDYASMGKRASAVSTFGGPKEYISESSTEDVVKEPMADTEEPRRKISDYISNKSTSTASEDEKPAVKKKVIKKVAAKPASQSFPTRDRDRADQTFPIRGASDTTKSSSSALTRAGTEARTPSIDTGAARTRAGTLIAGREEPRKEDVDRAMSSLSEKLKKQSFDLSPSKNPNRSYKSGGKVSSASSRGDGIAQRGKTKGRIC
jgi:hypothetical protein